MGILTYFTWHILLNRVQNRTCSTLLEKLGLSNNFDVNPLLVLNVVGDHLLGYKHRFRSSTKDKHRVFKDHCCVAPTRANTDTFWVQRPNLSSRQIDLHQLIRSVSTVSLGIKIMTATK